MRQRRAPAPSRSRTDERAHRRQLQREYQPEKRELHPEEAVAPVEIGRLLSKEHASKSRRNPECGRHTPQVVSAEQSAPADVVERAGKGFSTRDHRAKSKCKREDVNCR